MICDRSMADAPARAGNTRGAGVAPGPLSDSYTGEVWYGSRGPQHLLRNGTTVGVQPASRHSIPSFRRLTGRREGRRKPRVVDASLFNCAPAAHAVGASF